MKWNFKGLSNPKQLALAGITLGFMLVFGLIFEMYFKGASPVLGTVINITPTEMLIIIPLFILGIFPSLLISLAYVLLITMIKGTSSGFIGETALFIALISYVFSTVVGNASTRGLAKYGHLKRGIVTMIVATVFTTLIMTSVNIIWSTPSYMNFFAGKGWTTIFDYADKELIFTTVLTPNPYGGIIHGNLIKYGIASALALAILKSNILWTFKSKFVRPEVK